MKLINRLVSGSALIAVVMLFAASPVDAQTKQHTEGDIKRNIDIFADIYRQLDMYYVDHLSADTAIRWAINGMLYEMDRYTEYYPDDDQQDLKIMATGRYAGIGALIRAYKKEDRCVIEDVYEGCPAIEAGVQPGDMILSIDGRDTKGWPSAQVSENLRGEPGTTFELRVQRPGVKKPVAFKLQRRQIQRPSLPLYYMVDEDEHVGYLYLNSVTNRCSQDVRHAIIDLKQQGMKRLVFDLRNNGGGSVSEAVEIVGMFVPKGSLVVSTKGQLPATCHDYHTPSEPIDTLMPLVVMVNEESASAAEIISGALQDLDRAVIVGQRTYGKGIVQNVRDTPHGGQLKMTTARYYLPSGRCIQAYDYRRRFTAEAARTLPDSLTHEFRTRLGRIVRDGGGVLPDSVLPVDSTELVVYDLYSSDAFFDFVTDYRAKHASIAPAGKFSLTDDEYAEFSEAMAASDFNYNTRTATALNQLRELARAEGRYDESKAEFDALEAKLKVNDLSADIQRMRKYIQPYLEREIVARYYYEHGRLTQYVSNDKDTRTAIDIILKH